MRPKGRLLLVGSSVAFLLASSAAMAQLSKDQQKCVDHYNNFDRLVSAQAGKSARSCLKNAGKGAEPAPDNCIVNNTDGKIAGKASKVTALYAAGGACTGTGTGSGIDQGATTGINAHSGAITSLAHDIFNNPVTPAVISPGKDEAKCIDKSFQRSEQFFTEIVKDQRKCKKNGMKANMITGAASLTATCGTFAQIDTSSGGKVTAKQTKLTGDVTGACTGLATPLTTLFPGCSPADATALGLCLQAHTRCRACNALNAADGETVDCDTFDDGVANSSCPKPCGITAAGRYTETTTGGTLKVSTGTPFAFPAGGTTLQDVSAPDANCVSTTVIPYPGGLTVPIFCSLPSFAYTTQVVQHGCGIGVIDSNGGSDLTTTEHGDTSFTSGGCAAGQACGGAGVLTCGGSGQVNVDSSGEINITVGNGSADTCGSGGTGNAMVSIPVDTTTWGASEAGCDGGTNGGLPCSTNADCPGGICGTACPDPNGFDGSDTLITQFPQTLDLTTDTATAAFVDNDANGCACQGAGPQTLPSQTGQCIDFGAMTVNVAGGGTIFSSAAPLHDLLFTTVQNSTISGPAAFGAATCGSPPVINFAGTASRCIIAP